MTRVEHWPDRLLETVAFWETVPFVWGSTDCLGFALACVKAVRGSLPIEDLPAYSDAMEARRVLRDMGARELENAFMMHFEPVPVSMAQRGDIGVLVAPDGIQSAMVCLGPSWAGKTEDGLLQVPRSVIARAFRV
jgi:hypothetical protein